MYAFFTSIAFRKCRYFINFTCLVNGWCSMCFSSRQVQLPCWKGMGIFMHKYFLSFKHSPKAAMLAKQWKKTHSKNYRNWNLKTPDLKIRCAYHTSDLHMQLHINVICLATWFIMQFHLQFVSNQVQMPDMLTSTRTVPGGILCIAIRS